jgi:hypothetical protein
MFVQYRCGTVLELIFMNDYRTRLPLLGEGYIVNTIHYTLLMVSMQALDTLFYVLLFISQCLCYYLYMATKKKSPKKISKGFLSKVHRAVQEDVVKSLAIASILLNVSFLVCAVVLTSSNIFDRSAFNYAQSNYCKNISNVEARAEELGNEKEAINEWQISCVGKDFQPFYKEAVDKYRAQSNQQ